MMTEEEVRTMRSEHKYWMQSVGYTEEYIQNDSHYRIMTTIIEGRR